MSIFDKWFPSKASGAELALPSLVAPLAAAVPALERGDVEHALVRARLGDLCRDAGIDPVEPEAFDAGVRDLDGEGWRRLAALARTWEAPEVGAMIARLLQERGAGVVLAPMLAVARQKARLDMAVLRTSHLRVEELARAWLAAMDVAVSGETREQSVAALQRLDYERLLAQAEQAREAAEQRMKQIEEAQEAEDQARGPRRGKW